MDEVLEKVVDLVFQRDTTEIEKLIKSGKFAVNSFISLDRTALALAAACNYTDVMECLINNGADINLNNTGNLGYTPIESAARDGSLEAIELLLKHQAEIDKGNTIDSNALIGACIGAHTEVIKLLLKNGSDINHSDHNDETALHYLCQYAKQWGGGKITRTENGVTKEIENTRFQEHTAVFDLLLDKGADVNLETNYGYTSLHLVADSNTDSFVAPLVKKGADINYKNKISFVPLHAAARKGNTEVTLELLKNGADINSVDSDGISPLLFAVSEKKIAVAKLLIENGCDKSIQATADYNIIEKGNDALSVAEKLELQELIDLLK